MNLPAKPNKSFPTTQWSIVMRLRSDDAAVARQAVEDIFTSYRYPLYGYLRSTGVNHEDAEDVLQAFFEKMLRTESLGAADQDRGRLRTFLLTALSRFKLKFQRGEQRRHQRVCVEADLQHPDAARWLLESQATHPTPEHDYDRLWAAELIAHTRTRLLAKYAQRGRQALHDALAPLLSSADHERGAFHAISIRLGMTENGVRVALSRMRKDFRELLLEEVKRTLDTDGDARTEIQYLVKLLEG